MSREVIFKHQSNTKRLLKVYEPYFEEVKSMFTDKQDVQIYSTIVEGRLRDAENFSSIKTPQSWQYTEFINRARIFTIIDGGVYDGHHLFPILFFIKHKINIYGFEPLFESYLKSYCKVWFDRLGIQVFPMALWKHKGKVKFYEDKILGGSTIIPDYDGDYKKPKYIGTVSIDAFCHEKKLKVDYIKLDVEGAEYEVLQGAREILKKYRPQMAVSIYHFKEDLFRIPLLLKDTLNDYYYKIAHYTSSFMETILYAIPKEIYNPKRMISYRDSLWNV